MTKFISRFFIGCFTLLYAVFSIADIQILITDGSNTAKPIAVVPFSFNGNGSLDQNIEKIIASDLRNSGKFNPIDIRNMPQLPKTASEVAPKEWSTLGIDAVVIGDVKIDESMNYVIHYQLVDTVNNPGAILAENTYSVQNKWIRYAAHSASDEIFEKLSGIKGAFRTKIAYIVKMNSGNYPYELRISDYDGHEQVTIHRSKQPLMSPNWSPDGKKLVYVTFESGKSKLVMKTLETGALETIADYPQHNGAPSFSHDGSKLAFVLSKDGSLNIYVMDLVTKALKKITTGRSNNTEPSWMPDNRTLVYTSDQTGRPQIYSITVDGGVPQRITWDGTQNQNSRVSSDGHFMTMISTNNGIQNVTRFDFDSNNYQKLTNTFLDETPSISPNGIMIIYSSTQGLGSILNLVSTDGNFKAKLPATDGQVKFPAWSPYL